MCSSPQKRFGLERLCQLLTIQANKVCCYRNRAFGSRTTIKKYNDKIYQLLLPSWTCSFVFFTRKGNVDDQCSWISKWCQLHLMERYFGLHRNPPSFVICHFLGTNMLLWTRQADHLRARSHQLYCSQQQATNLFSAMRHLWQSDDLAKWIALAVVWKITVRDGMVPARQFDENAQAIPASQTQRLKEKGMRKAMDCWLDMDTECPGSNLCSAKNLT